MTQPNHLIETWESLQTDKGGRKALSHRQAFDTVLKNFTLAEFEQSQMADYHGIDNTMPRDRIPALLGLCKHILLPLRFEVQSPIIINSGYRCPELNALLKSKATSQHTLGQAADIRVVGRQPLAVAHLINDLGLPYDDLIWEGSWVHVSYSDRHQRDILHAEFFFETDPATGRKVKRVKYRPGLPPRERS